LAILAIIKSVSIALMVAVSMISSVETVSCLPLRQVVLMALINWWCWHYFPHH
jgi:hypothetical protein